MRTIYLHYEFEEVNYTNLNGARKSEYGVEFDYEYEITPKDIMMFYLSVAIKDDNTALQVIKQMEMYDLINYDVIEDDRDFIDYLKQEHETDAYRELVKRIEDDLRDY